MKGTRKILLVLAIMLMLSITLTVYAFGADTAPASEDQGYAFEVKKPGQNAIRYTDASQLSNSEGLDTATPTDGMIVTLLSDCIITDPIHCGKQPGPTDYNADKLYDADTATPINVYLDLNGYDLIFDYYTTYTFIEVGNNVNFHLYSSREGGVMASTCQKNTTGGIGYTLFNLRYNGASLVVGEIAPPLLRESYNNYTDNQSKAVTCSGDNLTTYSGSLFTTNYNSQTTGAPYIHHNDVTVDIKGGTHYRTKVSTRPGLLILEGVTTINVENTTFIAEDSGTIFATTAGLGAPANAYFKNCTFISDNLVYHSSSYANIIFDNCFIACDNLITQAADDYESPLYKNCTLTAGLIPQSSGHIVKTYVVKQYPHNIITYNYSDTTFDDTKYTETKLNTAEPYSISKVNLIKEYRMATVSSGDFATITWVGLDGKTITEEWIKSDTVIPTPAIPYPAATDACKYVYSPKLTATSNGDATYTMMPAANFSIKTNLALYADFVYNIYIPQDIADNYINYVKFESYENIYLSGQASVIINGNSYYVVKKSISPIEEGDRSFDFIINIKDKDGNPFDQTYTLSIPDYIDRVIDGEYSELAKNMVIATRTYIKAARNYYAGTSLPYPEASNPDLTALAHKPGTDIGAMGAELAKYLKGVNLWLDGEIRFRLYLQSGVTSANLTLTYPKNTELTTVTTQTGWEYDSISELYYYDIAMSARDLRSDIEISVTGQSESPFVYSLSNYAYFVNQSLNDPLLSKLVDALWNYSVVANRYSHGTGTPDVDIVIGNNIVAADSHVIVASGDELPAATKLQAAIYDKTGELLEIVSEISSDKNNIIVALDTPVVNYDMRVYTDGEDLYFSCGYKSFIDSAVNEFINSYITPSDKRIDFGSDFVENYYTDRVYYSDFGALGQGSSSSAVDFAAINATHKMANTTKRHTVYADSNAEYYITDTRLNGNVTTISIKTNVVWGNAKFIIDDSKLSVHKKEDMAILNKHVFAVESDYPKTTIKDKQTIQNINSHARINKYTKKIDLGLDYPAMLVPCNTNHKVFRRIGYSSSWKGDSMHEIIIVDKYGNVDPSTPIMFDYSTISYIDVYRIDIEPITLDGGIFESVASNISITYTGTDGYLAAKQSYIQRGIKVNRSFTTVKNLNHIISGEISLERQKLGELGSAYQGFYYAEDATNVTYENCIMSGRRYYAYSYKLSNDTSRRISCPGTYDINTKGINKLVYKNCVQSNFFVDDNANAVDESAANAKLSMATSTVTGQKMYWGIGGSNYCKNIAFIGSTLSRLDAHAGLYNGKIIDSTVNYISLAGCGDFIVENSKWYAEGDGAGSNSIIHLRSDYGSTWQGTIQIKNLKAYPHVTTQNVNNVETHTVTESTYLFYHTYNNWYFGYRCYFPNLYVDNLEYYNWKTGEALNAGHTINFVTSSVTSEPYLHLDETFKTHPRNPDVDENNDKISDITGEAVQTSGIQDTSSNTNLNPVVPPVFVKITNNDGVNGAGGYNFVFPSSSTTSFFKDTDIKIIDYADTYVPDIDYPIDRDFIIDKYDTPFVDFNTSVN